MLIRRGVVPEKGKWSLPAGFMDPGEPPTDCVAREVLEETALTVQVTRLVECYYKPPGMGASVTLVYRCSVVKGELQAGDDASDAAFFNLDTLPELAFASTVDVVRRARRAIRRAQS